MTKIALDSPGPCRVPTCLNSYSEPSHYVVDAHGVAIARMLNKNQTQNARFFAAAPDAVAERDRLRDAMAKIDAILSGASAEGRKPSIAELNQMQSIVSDASAGAEGREG